VKGLIRALRSVWSDVRSGKAAADHGRRIRAEVAAERRAELARLVDDGYPPEAIRRIVEDRPKTSLWRNQEARLAIADRLDPDGAR